jgi:hypothetical protein
MRFMEKQMYADEDFLNNCAVYQRRDSLSRKDSNGRMVWWKGGKQKNEEEGEEEQEEGEGGEEEERKQKTKKDLERERRRLRK